MAAGPGALARLGWDSDPGGRTFVDVGVGPRDRAVDCLAGGPLHRAFAAQRDGDHRRGKPGSIYSVTGGADADLTDRVRVGAGPGFLADRDCAGAPGHTS